LNILEQDVKKMWGTKHVVPRHIRPWAAALCFAGAVERVRTSVSFAPKDDEAKSLFRNILPVTPCGSRFCPDRGLYSSHKSLQMNILENQQKKCRETHDGTQEAIILKAQI